MFYNNLLKDSLLLISLVLVISIITSTAISGGYAVAQSNLTSNVSSTSVTNTSTSAKINSPYRFERGYPAGDTSEQAYNNADLGRAIETYKFFYPMISLAIVFFSHKKANQFYNK